MLAARLTSVCRGSAGVLLRPTLAAAAPRPPLAQLARGYREPGRPFARRSRLREAQAQVAETAAQATKGKVGAMEVGQIAVAGGAVLGIGALCYYGLGMSNEPGAIDRVVIWPQYVRDRIRDTYSYFGASCVAVGASAVAVFRSPLGHRFFALCSRHPIMSTVGILVGLVGTGQAMMSIPYSPGLGAKQMMWLVNCGMLGLAIAPIGALGGAIAIRAAWYTAGIIGGLSTVAVCAPSDKFLNWAGPLGIGLGGVLVASLGSAFLPASSSLAMPLYSISLYGGLLLFSAFLLYDTQKVGVWSLIYGLMCLFEARVRCYKPLFEA
ncbi:growth hormone-inducible transmembrane protein-like isoform X3 [Eriocheir sinensis]|uniref:growth hormone-inducible transmembrane protein-like isoform X2 n=1 Tax=Eriocheir sinensis TaxID=95602 RepID=UPI0021C56E1E|nr:growth hormone-inducible transmembrane protein-like isoform X2 [Eriocheir sinensis]XP_050687970.1 growth hormone-inducible transmembrane protein-like isoform X3 [Eriocheir sinensis]